MRDGQGRDAGADRYRTIAEGLGTAISWADSDAGKQTLGAQQSSLTSLLTQKLLEANRLMNASTRRPCIGVYGPSQAGKSYLIGALSRRQDETMKVRFADGQQLDFLQRINPEGDKESTGLVTRFSVRSGSDDPAFPVALRLLSTADVIKIIVDFYYANLIETDAEHIQSEEEIKKAARSSVEQMSRLATAHEGSNGFSDLLAADIQRYVETWFPQQCVLGRKLDTVAQDYWKNVRAVLPRLKVREAVALLAPLWGERDTFSKLATSLLLCLSQLDFADMAYVPVEAIAPENRGESIINVEMLSGIGRDEAPVDVRYGQGKTTNVPRAMLTALVAEVHLQLSEEPSALFREVDLLDFPGARANLEKTVDQMLASDDGAKDLILRGKVSFLFKRYLEDLELTSMMLCVPNGNQDAPGLPRSVEAWVHATHGQTPEQRAHATTSLYVVLTKFDRTFERKKGESSDFIERWNTRVETSFPKFLGNAIEWPRHWVDDRPFKNTFWMRNPAIQNKALFTIENGRETGFNSSETAEWVVKMRADYLRSDEVNRYFSDPQAAWDAAMKLNDGGVSYLLGALGPGCSPTVKRSQIERRFAGIAVEAAGKLSPYIDESDPAALTEQQMKRMLDIVRSLWKRRDMFGPFLRELLVDPENLAGIYRDVARRVDDEPVRQADSGFIDSIFNGQANGTSPRRSAEKKEPSRLHRFAEKVCESWYSQLDQLADADYAPDMYGVSHLQLQHLVNEYRKAAERKKIAIRITQQTERLINAQTPLAEASKRAGVAAAAIINRFSAALGFDDLPEDQRPLNEATGRPIFTVVDPERETPLLGEEPASHHSERLVDWGFALRATAEHNALGGPGQTAGVESRLLREAYTALKGSR